MHSLPLEPRRRRPRAIAARLVVAAATTSLIAGCGPNWPTVRAVYHPEFVGDPARVASVDVLPAEIYVMVDRGLGVDRLEAAEAINAVAMSETLEGLRGRGYRVSWLDWQGRHHGNGLNGRAMDPSDFRTAMRVLGRYGDDQMAAVAAGKPRTLATELPVRLGRASGSDSTLYIGGRAFVGTPPRHNHFAQATAGTVASLSIAAIALAAGDGKRSSSRKRSRTRNHKRSARGKSSTASKPRRRSKPSARSVLNRTRDHRTRSRSKSRSGPVSETVRRTRDHRERRSSRPRTDSSPRSYSSSRRPSRHVTVYESEPGVSVYYDGHEPEVQPEDFAWVELEMVLVDNETGHVQWHVRQHFDIAPQNSRRLRSAVRFMLATLPNRATARPGGER